MAIGPDGFIEQRIETLYVSEEYKMFLLTGQKNGGSWRKAYISARPFHTLDDDTLEAMKAQAKPLDKNSSIEISANQESLNIRDAVTGTNSLFPISELDEEIRQRLRYTGSPQPDVSSAWDKYAKKPEAVAAAPKKNKAFTL